MALQCQTHSFTDIVSIKSSDWHYNAQTSHFQMPAPGKFSDQNKSLGVNLYRELSSLRSWRSCETRPPATQADNYQILAADVDISWGKLLFEIDIIGQPKFPLTTEHPATVSNLFLRIRCSLKINAQWNKKTVVTRYSPGIERVNHWNST